MGKRTKVTGYWIAAACLAAVCFAATNARAAIERTPSGWRVTAGRLAVEVPGGETDAMTVGVGQQRRQGPGGLAFEEFTPEADKPAENEPAAADPFAGFDPTKIEGLVGIKPVSTNRSELIESVSLARIGAKMYLFRIDLTKDYERAEKNQVIVYVDADVDANTGRVHQNPWNAGQDFWLVVDGLREPYAVVYDKDGNRTRAKIPFTKIDKDIIWFAYDADFLQTDYGTRGKMQAVVGQGDDRSVWSFDFSENLPQIKTDLALEEAPETEVATTPLKRSGVELAQGRLVETYKLGDHASAKCVIESDGDAIHWTIDVTNLQDGEGLYEVGLRLPVPHGDDLSFWDGAAYEAASNPTGRVGANHMSGASMPMCCVASGGEGFVLGFHPFQITAHMANSLTPQGDGRHELKYVTRVALAPKASYQVRFVAMPFVDKHGYLDAAQRYVDAFPEAFEPRPGIDPLLRGTELMALYYRYAYNPDLYYYQGDLVRRLTRGQGGWSWMYRPGVYPGDWFLLDPDNFSSRYFEPPHRPFTHDPEGAGDTLEEYEKKLKMKCQEAHKHLAAGAFYINPVWCGSELAEEKFPDAVVDAENNPQHRLIEKWAQDYAKNEPILSNYVFSSGTSWGAFQRRGIRHVAETFGPSAIAFDSSPGVETIQGPAIRRATVRSFDPTGKPFSIQGVGIAELMDFTRTLTTFGGRPLAVVPNWHQSGTFLVAFRSDTILLERHPLGWSTSIYPQLRKHRMVAGAKTITMNRSYWPPHYRHFNWDKMSPREIVDTFRLIRDETILCSVELGYLPGVTMASGVPKLHDAMPLLESLALAGWQPSPRASLAAEGDVALSRFGKGQAGYFTVTNHGKSDEAARLTVDPRGAARTALADWKDAAVDNRMTEAGTELALDLPARDFRALQKVAWVVGLPDGAVVKTQWERTPFKERTLVFAIDSPKAVANASWTLPRLDGVRLAEVTLDGRKIDGALSEDSGAATFTAPLGAGASTLRATYRPPVAVEGELATLLDIDFLADAEAVAIVTAEGYEEATNNYAAWRIQEYFRYYKNWVMQEEGLYEIPIATTKPDAAKVAIVLTPRKGAAGEIHISPTRIEIVGDEQTLPRATLTLLSMLDHKYDWIGPFITSAADWTRAWEKEHWDDLRKTRPYLTKAGLLGKQLTGEIGDPIPE